VASGAISEQAFFVLAVLADGPCHGYGIVREVSELSEGRVHLKIGGLYGMLERLVSEELIELDREEVTDGRLRRYYRLTRGGLEILDAETDRMEAIASVARARLDQARQSRPSPRVSPRVIGDGAAS
jgi:DNA-binding PadR family transcriptional regulator